jgi:hypothetical protein
MLYNSMKSKDIMFCPSDNADRNPAAANAYTYTLAPVSYRWKYAIDKAWRESALKCQKEGDFGYNSDQIVFYERAGFHSGAAGGLKNDVMINVVFLDTHVKSVSVANCANIATATILTYTPTADGEPNFFNFDNDSPKVAGTNPPIGSVSPGTSAPYKYLDPRRYSDMMP